MKKLAAILSGLLGYSVLVSLTACNLDTTAEPEPDKLGIYLPIGSTTLDSRYNDSTWHSYNAEGKMIKYSRLNGNTSILPVHLKYDDLGRLTEIQSVQSSGEKRIYNAQGQLYKIYHLRSVVDPTYITEEQTLEYDASGKLIKIHSLYFNGGSRPPSTQVVNKFTYNPDGLISIDSLWIQGPWDSTLWYFEKVEYEYDNKKGVHEFGIGNYGPNYYLSKYLYEFAPLRHNITSLKMTVQNEPPRHIALQYIYNEQDFPVKITAFENGKWLYNTSITYKYF